MEVNQPVRRMAQARPVWDRCRAAIAGSDAVKAAGAIYLPLLAGAGDRANEANSAYLARAIYFNAAQRTHDVLVGTVMARPAAREIPPALEGIAADIDQDDTRLEDYVRHAVGEVLAVGGMLAVVDYPTRPEDVLTARQEREMGLRPFVATYRLEDVLDWRKDKAGITFLRLRETVEEPDGDWGVKEVEQVRVYDTDDGAVRVRLYRKGESGKWAVDGEEVRLTGSGGQAFTRVPAVWFGPDTDEPGKPPLLDLIDVNLGHYRNSADMEHALHFTGLPTPYVSGVSPDELPDGLTLGAGVGYVFSEVQAQVRFATYGADGLGALDVAMQRKVDMMASLGARMLATDSKAAESGDALAIRRGGENSALAKVADSVSASVVRMLAIMADWAGVTGEIAYSLDTDYLPERITAQEITALMGAWQGGGITAPELFERFKAGGLIRDGKTFSDHEAEAIEDDL